MTAPDENPTEVKGMGTEHNNLVISWKVFFISYNKYYQNEKDDVMLFYLCTKLFCAIFPSH